MTRIFISHSHSDEAIAFKLVKFLLAALKIEYEEFPLLSEVIALLQRIPDKLGLKIVQFFN